MNENELLEDEQDFSDELYEHHRFFVDKGQEPLRIDKYIVNFVQNATRNKVQSAIDAGNVLVNEKAVKSSYKVKAFDVIRVVLPHPIRNGEIIAENIPINIVYEDDEVLVVDKQASMVVHPGHGNYRGTLVNALAYHFDNLPKNSDNRPGLVHRIDKDTSGLLVIAKTDFAMAHLSKQFFDHSVGRIYKALVWGDFENQEGTYTGNIGRNPKDRMQMTVFEDGSAGKPAISHYKVEERFGYVTLVSCRLQTGRTHQIRTHFSYFGHNLFGDKRYGGDKILKGTTSAQYKKFVENTMSLMPRQALHAQYLSFNHPKSGERLEFFSALPQEFDAVLNKWRDFVKSRNE